MAAPYTPSERSEKTHQASRTPAFEIHLTVAQEHAEGAEAVARKLHWKTSEIARDPVLGKKTYFYLTTHTSDIGAAFDRIAKATQALKISAIPLIREKIELIVHDIRHEVAR